jgi:hypothetical protein
MVDAGNSANVSGICCNLTEPELVTSNGTAHTGNTALLYSGYGNSTAASYAYLKAFDLSSWGIKISSDTVLSYWIYPQSPASNSKVSGNNSTCIAIDLIFSDSTDLRASSTVDQNGNPLSPAGQCNHLTLDTWNFVRSAIDGRGASRTLKRIDVGYDQATNPGGYAGYIDDISLYNPLPSNPHVAKTTYPTADDVVADFDVTSAPYDADATGAMDATTAIQNALFDCSNAGGGTVWMPAGKYKVTGSIIIPPHTTLRGDWRDPDRGSGSYGTVILAVVSPGESTDPSLFRVTGMAGVDGLTVYYPNQSLTQPISYPYTFEIPGGLSTLLEGQGYMMSTIEHVTLLDSYRGISAGAQAIHELPTISYVKGTVLATGLYLQNTADVGHTENVTLNNSYWTHLDPSLSHARPTRAMLDAWTRANGTGMMMGGLEWDHLENLSFSDYQVGIDVVQQNRTALSASLFGIIIQNSNIALRINGNYVSKTLGLQIANSTLQANQGLNPIAIQIEDTSDTTLHFNSDIIGGGATSAVQITGNDLVEFQGCTFDNWSGPAAISANNGSLVVEGSIFTSTLSPQKVGISLQAGLSSATLLGNHYTGSPLYTNSSSARVAFQDHGFNFVNDGLTSYTFAPTYKPGVSNFYNVKLAPYNAAGNGVTNDTSAIQHALNDASKAGGGIVYLPPAIYVVSTHLTVPANVELRGADSVPHRTIVMNGGQATGTILYAYEGRGTGTPDIDTAFITLNGNHAGIRGISIHYPQQANDSVANIVAYPWTIRGNGIDVYVYNVSFSNAFKGIDFATDQTNEHVISGVNGFALATAIKVGNSSAGWVENNLFNINAWARTGGLPNSVVEGNRSSAMWTVANSYSTTHEIAYWATSGAQNEHWMDDFTLGAQTGFLVDSTANVTAINIGSDGDVNTIDVLNTGSSGATFVNVAGCGCNAGGIGLHIRAGLVGVYSFMAIASAYKQAISIEGGTYALEGASFCHDFATVTGGTGSMAGIWFHDAGVQVTVSGSQTIANLWGNIGTGDFKLKAIKGASLLAAGNIPR